MSGTIILRNVRPLGASSSDLLIEAGRFAGEAKAGEVAGAQVIDGAGLLMLPGLVEAHTHLDKNLIGMPWYRNEIGPAGPTASRLIGARRSVLASIRRGNPQDR